MYYHVIVETTEKNKKDFYERCYEIDCLNLDEIKDLIIKPYLNNTQVYVNGRHIEKQKIRSLKVKSSERTAGELRDIAQSRVARNIFFPWTVAMILDSNEYVTDITKEVLKSVGTILPSTSTAPKVSNSKNNSVFIVHGRDDLAKTEVARFVEKLGLTAVILHERASGGNTIIEKIEEHTNVGFAIVLYTPCDVGSLANEKDQRFRARQNVVFEHGYLIAKLSRKNVCALVKGDVEIPNDISGVVYVSFDDHGAWHFQLAKELRQAGYTIDMNNLI